MTELTPEQRENCERLARFLGFEHVHEIGIGCRLCHPPDFYRDETASAMLIEKMSNVGLWHNPNGQWTCEPNIDDECEVIESHADRKTAIVNAALKVARQKESA